VQTGGYGQLGRSFGLFGDHVLSLEIIDHDGQEKEITRSSDPDLFFAWLGGSPGNFGVLTHFSIEVYRDADYHGSLGLRAVHAYDTAKLRQLLGHLAEMSDDENFPRNYDLCISVLSADFDIPGLIAGLDEQMREEHPEIFGADEKAKESWPRMIVVYAQYVPFGPHDKPAMEWFEQFKTGAYAPCDVEEKPMSELTAQWIFCNTRKFDHPYVKRAYLTKSTTLVKDGWVDWAVRRMDEIVGPTDNGQWLSAQLQSFGGKHSMFTKNAGNGTSYSLRVNISRTAIISHSIYSGVIRRCAWSSTTSIFPKRREMPKLGRPPTTRKALVPTGFSARRTGGPFGAPLAHSTSTRSGTRTMKTGPSTRG
jgi:hypothetical protein